MNGAQHKFLLERLKRIEAMLEERCEYEAVEKGRFRYRTLPVANREYRQTRELTILNKLLQQVDDTNVLKALKSWRSVLGKKLRMHRAYYRKLQDTYDAWDRLPWPVKIEIPEPPQVPDPKIVDRQGQVWVIDDPLLDILDDMICRLQKWLNYENTRCS